MLKLQTPRKKMKELSKWAGMSLFMVWKGSYLLRNQFSLKSHLWIQGNPSQNPSRIFCRDQQTDSKIENKVNGIANFEKEQT